MKREILNNVVNYNPLLHQSKSKIILNVRNKDLIF